MFLFFWGEGGRKRKSVKLRLSADCFFFLRYYIQLELSADCFFLRYYIQLESMDAKIMQTQISWMNILKSFKNSIEIPFQRLPSLLLSFLSHSLFVLARPEHKMYDIINKKMSQSPMFSLNSIPLLKILPQVTKFSSFFFLFVGVCVLLQKTV